MVFVSGICCLTQMRTLAAVRPRRDSSGNSLNTLDSDVLQDLVPHLTAGGALVAPVSGDGSNPFS
jgi:hypothetical protein